MLVVACCQYRVVFLIAPKNIIADLNKGDKLDGNNYDKWYRTMIYLIDEQKVTYTLESIKTRPELANDAAPMPALNDFEKWDKDNWTARNIMLSSMHFELVPTYETYGTANEMWNALKEEYGEITASKTRVMSMEFDAYRMALGVNLRDHLRKMNQMIADLTRVGNVLTEDQKIIAVLLSLPDSWRTIKQILTHSEAVKTFKDLCRHLELEAQRVQVEIAGQALFAKQQPVSGLVEKESRDVDFFEYQYPKKKKTRLSIELFEIDDVSYQGEPTPLAGLSGRDLMESQASGSDHDALRRSSHGFIPNKYFEIEGTSYAYIVTDEDEPRSYQEAMESVNSKEWMLAMNNEISSMRKNYVWDLVDLPKDRKAITNKWVLKIKRKVDGSIDKFKARLVAKGFTQKEGVDYEETFSPMVRFSSIRMILSIVTHMDLELHQMNVKTAFLNSDLKEEIYMKQPIGYVEKGHEDKVCKLHKSIYGLKQSSRQWYKKFHNTIMLNGFSMCYEDHCVYNKRSKQKSVLLSLYVDDILLVCNDIVFLNETKDWLSTVFEIKDLGEAEFILEVKITRNRIKRILGLSQTTYIEKILEKFRMANASPVETPIDKGCKLSVMQCPQTDADTKRMASIPYASAVGSLMYAMLSCTCPDICYAVGLVSRFQSNPGIAHWNAVKRIFRYLKGTKDMMLCYLGGGLSLLAYRDSSFSDDSDDGKSTSGYVFLLGGGAISWSRPSASSEGKTHQTKVAFYP
ncbi:hypothetical protein AAC387_Pa10g1957 [Persea americana]